MRTEVKVGLVVGLVLILSVVLYAVKQSGSGSNQTDKIGFDVKGNKGQGVEVVQLPGDTKNQPRKTTPDKTTPPKTTKPPAAADKPPVTSAPRNTSMLPPIAANPTTGPAVPARGPEDKPLYPAGREPQPASSHPALEPNTAPVEPSVSREPNVAVPPRPTPVPTTQPAPRSEPNEPAKPAPAPGKYTVQAGDTLSSIAREHYGDPELWPKIAAANPGMNPDRLLEGQVIVLPPKEGAAPEPNSPPPAGTPKKEEPKTGDANTKPAPETYTVQEGDTLVSIARAVYGDASRWREIFDLNKDKIKSADVLYVGTRLKMPAKEKAKTAETKPNNNKKPAAKPKPKP